MQQCSAKASFLPIYLRERKTWEKHGTRKEGESACERDVWIEPKWREFLPQLKCAWSWRCKRLQDSAKDQFETLVQLPWFRAIGDSSAKESLRSIAPLRTSQLLPRESIRPLCRLSLPQSEAIVLQRSNQLKYHWTVFQPQENPTSEIWEAINIPQSDLWSDFFCSRQIYRFLVFASARYFFWFLLACCDVLGTGWAISWQAFELQDPCRLAYRTKQPT